MAVTVLRHCESTFNADPASAQKDCPLSPAGERHASTLRGHYDLVLVSPLLRARAPRLLNVATPSSVTVFSVPPATTASTSPSVRQRAAVMMASLPEEHAVHTANEGPLKPWRQAISLGATSGVPLGTSSGETRVGYKGPEAIADER